MSLPDDVVPAPAMVRALAAVARADTADGALQKVCAAAKAVMPQVAEASVTVLRPDRPATVAASGDLAVAADAEQYAVDDGPCLQAARSGKEVVVDDVGREQRWPAYIESATAAGVRASVSVPIRVADGLAGALNLYAVRPGVFDDDTVALAGDLVAYVMAVVSSAAERDRATAFADQMRHAMESRSVIEQAKGIVMAQRGCDPQAAFDVLVRISQETHRKLRDVAEQMVEQVSSQPD